MRQISVLLVILLLVSFLDSAIIVRPNGVLAPVKASGVGNGLVAYWNFDEGSGTVAHDSSGNGNDGILCNGPTWVNGTSGSAPSFDGVDDYVNITENTDLNPHTSNWTISAWVNIAQLTDCGNSRNYAFVIVDKRQTISDQSLTLMAGWGSSATSQARFGFIFDGERQLAGAQTPSMNVFGWHYVAGVREGGNLYVYVDGVEYGPNNVCPWGNYLTANTDVSSSTPIHLANHGAWQTFFDGTIDEVRIYSRALTQQQIIIDMHANGARAPAYFSETGNYYEAISVPNGLTWNDALNLAQSFSYIGVQGHLATVTSQAENDFIINNLGGPVALNRYWLGGFQPPGSPEPAGGWRWVTGELWNYTNWSGGEPSNNYGGEFGGPPAGTPEDVLQFWANNGHWNDMAHASYQPGLIIEYDVARSLSYPNILVVQNNDTRFWFMNYALNHLAIPHTNIVVSDLPNTNLSDYQVIFFGSSIGLLSDVKPYLDASASDIAAWVANGGSVFVEGQFVGSGGFDLNGNVVPQPGSGYYAWVPGSPDFKSDQTANAVHIVCPTHPLVENLTDASLSGWDTAPNGCFDSYLGHGIAVQSGYPNGTALFVYGLGKGVVICSCLNSDYHTNYDGRSGDGQNDAEAFIENVVIYCSHVALSQNREPIIYQVTVNPQVMEEPASISIEANASDYEDYLNLTVMCIIRFPNQTVQLLNMTLTNSLFTLQYPILSTYPSGTYSLTVRAVNHVGGSCDYQTTFEVTTPVLKGSACGWVTNSTGQPIPNSKVTLSLKTAYLTYTALTDNEGIYSLTRVIPGQYNLITSASGYATNTTDVEVSASQISYQNVTLKHLPILTGTVNTQYAAPIANATITATGNDHSSVQAQTDTSGSYTTVLSGAGTFVATASASEYSLNSTTLTCSLDQVVSANFSLVKNGKLIGTVTDAISGAPIPNATTILCNNQYLDNQNTNSSGQFSYRSVSPSSYAFAASANNYLPNATTIILYSNQTTTLQITLTPTGNITGTVKEAAESKPVQGATVCLIDNRGATIAAVLTDTSGGYLFYLVKPENYTLRIYAYGYNTTSSTVSVTALATSTVNFTLVPSAMDLTLQASSAQYSRGETATFTLDATDAQGHSIASNITSISITLKNVNNETRSLTYSQEGDHFIASYTIQNNETMGTWTVTATVDDIFGNRAETVVRILILEPFYLTFLTDKQCYTNGEKVNFSAYVLRYSNLTRFLNSTEVSTTVTICDAQNGTVATFNLTHSGNAFIGELDTSNLPKGAYTADLTVSDAEGNVDTASTTFAVVQDFHATVNTDKNYYNRTEPVHIFGDISFTNGTSAANVSVLMVLTVKSYSRSFWATTNDSGLYDCYFTPLGIDAGNYTVICSAEVEGILRSVTCHFVLLGLALNPSDFIVSMSENSVNDFSIKILNTGETALAGISANISPHSIGGVTVIVVSTSQSTIAPGDYAYFTFRVNATEGATSNTEFNVTVTCDQNAIEFGQIEVNLFPAVPALQVKPQIIDVSLAPADYLTATITLTNVGCKTLYNATLTSPLTPWITLTTDHVGDIAPQETKLFDVLINPTNSTPIGLYQDSITVVSNNYQPVTVYIIVKITTAQNGTLVFHVTDESHSPVPNARVTVQFQEYWLQAETNLTDSNGYCTFSSLTGGRYSYAVSAENHETASGTTIVEQGSTICVEVVAPLQVMQVSFNVVPITIQDQYYIVLNMTFQTDVPQPMLIPIPPELQFQSDKRTVMSQGFDSTMDFTLQNTGLISVFNVSILATSPLPKGYNISFGLFGQAIHLDEIQAKSTVEVPCELTIQPNTDITSLENGVVGKVKIEGYFTYFDNDQNAKQARVNAEVLITIIDRGTPGPVGNETRRLDVEPSVIYGINFNHTISFTLSSGFSSSRLPNVTITNRAEGEDVYLLTTASGGGFTLGIDLLGALAGTFTGDPTLGLSLGWFLAFGHITRYNAVPEDPIYHKDWLNLVDLDVANPLHTVLLHELYANVNNTADPTWLDLGTGESALLQSEMWDLPGGILSWADLFKQIVDVWVSLGFSVTVGFIVFLYKWQNDTIPLPYAIPIFIVDINGPSIYLPVPAGPVSGGTVTVSGGTVPWEAWWSTSGNGVINMPTVTYGNLPPQPPVPSQPPPSFHEVVKLSISQEVTLERDAFSATLQMKNTMASSEIDNVSVTLSIEFSNGSDARQNFYFNLSSLQGINDVDGTGIIHPGATALASWLIIPIPGAGGTGNKGVYYMIQANIYYTVNQTLFNLSSSVETINVQPQPYLALDYYLPETVTANMPFELGIRVTNAGYGAARNFKIDSAQPVIYENLAHLLINFTLIGSYVQSTQVSNSLNMVFGDIQPGQAIVGYWLMVSTVNDTFTEFTATYTHSSALGGEETSLIAVSTHILMREIMTNDASVAFLIGPNDIAPDQIVDPSTGASATVIPENYNVTRQDSASLTIQTEKLAGCWICIPIDDPSNNQESIVEVQRSDGKILNPQNYWMANGKIFILDDPEENYTILYSLSTDLAFDSIALLKTIIGEGYLTSINATVEYHGYSTETFNLTVYANSTAIKTQLVTLTNGSSTTVTFTWNTTLFAKGNYTISAYAQPVLGETNTADNNFTYGLVNVVIPGDVDGNGRVNMGDISTLCDAFGSTIGPDGNYWHRPPGILDPFSPNLDIDGNGRIDMGDIVTALNNFGQHYP
jgi:hypothetical protein